MKLKTILLTVTVLSSVLFSCSEENIINGPIVSGEDAILSVNLSIKEDAVSKSGIEYENPVSDNEQLMKNYVIAIFDAGGTTRVGFKQDKFTEAQKSFTVDVVAKGGNNRQVLTIANLTDAQYTACANYTSLGEFKALEASQTTAFKSDNLMKVKLQNANLTAGQVTPLSIELVQLPARVDVAIAFNDADAKAGASFEIRGFEVTGINTASDVVLTNTVLVENTKNTTSSVTWTGDARKTFSFYTYEKETANETVNIKITGLLKENAGDAGVQKTYTYALNPVQGGECKTTGIVHGNVYELKGLMNLTSKTVTFSVTTKDWTPVEVGADIKDVHYLFVKEHLVYMANVSSYEIEFAADLTVSKQGILSATYEDYYLDGNKIKKRTSNCKGDQIPEVVVDNENKLLKVISVIPNNYFPKTITFTVTNGQGLSEDVKIIQYPPQYLEGTVSANAGPRVAGDGDTNPNIFTITTISSTKFPIGDPKDGSTTKQDLESNEIVSPKFIVASRYGTVYATSFSSTTSVKRCSEYWETLDKNKTGKQATYPTGTWRVPTLAELEFMNMIQDNSSSVNYLFNSSGSYWSARLKWYYDFGENRRGEYSDATSTRSDTYIRCVHDVY